MLLLIGFFWIVVAAIVWLVWVIQRLNSTPGTCKQCGQLQRITGMHGLCITCYRSNNARDRIMGEPRDLAAFNARVEEAVKDCVPDASDPNAARAAFHLQPSPENGVKVVEIYATHTTNKEGRDVGRLNIPPMPPLTEQGCPECGGVGVVRGVNCPECSGEGFAFIDGCGFTQLERMRYDEANSFEGRCTAAMSVLARIIIERKESFSPDAVVRGVVALGKWQEAVIDALVVNHQLSERHLNDPRAALNDLIAAEVQMSLDPRISLDAIHLIERHRGIALHGANEDARHQDPERLMQIRHDNQTPAVARSMRRFWNGLKQHPPFVPLPADRWDQMQTAEKKIAEWDGVFETPPPAPKVQHCWDCEKPMEPGTLTYHCPKGVLCEDCFDKLRD